MAAISITRGFLLLEKIRMNKWKVFIAEAETEIVPRAIFEKELFLKLVNKNSAFSVENKLI